MQASLPIVLNTDTVLRWLANEGWLNAVPFPEQFAVGVVNEINRTGLDPTRSIIARECQKQLSPLIYRQCREGSNLWRECAFTSLGSYLLRRALAQLPDEALAHDVTQDALVSIFRNLDKVRIPQAFLGFCLVTLLHEVGRAGTSLVKDRNRKVPIVDEGDEEEDGDVSDGIVVIDPEPLPIDIVSYSDSYTGSRFWECLNACRGLSDLQKRILHWMYKEDLSNTELCQRLGMTLNALHQTWWRIRRALRSDPRLRDCLGEIGLEIGDT
jgi:DNA-directed RNA polymerase specialized sigma24 family protein